MYKKIFASFLLFLSLSFMTVASAEEAKDIMTITREAGYTVQDINRPKSSIVVDANTGDILWQDNIDAVRDPASMSKMFTLYLLFEELAKGKITLDTTVKATETDQAISGIYEISNNKIVAGVDYPIKDLITMTVVPSSNAATVMIANYLSNNDAGAFMDRINQTAKDLGMTNTYFSNASGTAAQAFHGYYTPQGYNPAAPNQTSSHDLAILIYQFLNKYPDILKFTNQSLVKTMVGTPYQEEFHSYNYSLPGDKYGLEGVDGLKTGSSPTGAFNAMVTAKRGKTRLITIVMGVGDWSDQDGEYYRHPFINALTSKTFKDISEKKEKREANLFPRKAKRITGDISRPSNKHKDYKEPKSLIAKIEHFIDYHHKLVFICLGLFIILVVLLVVIAMLH